MRGAGREAESLCGYGGGMGPGRGWGQGKPAEETPALGAESEPPAGRYLHSAGM